MKKLLISIAATILLISTPALGQNYFRPLSQILPEYPSEICQSVMSMASIFMEIRLTGVKKNAILVVLTDDGNLELKVSLLEMTYAMSSPTSQEDKNNMAKDFSNAIGGFCLQHTR